MDVGEFNQHKSEIPVYFSWSHVDYKFVSDEAFERWYAATNHKSGAIILWDLVNKLKRWGWDVEPDLHPRSMYTPDMIREPLKRYEKGGRMGQFNTDAFAKAYDRVRRMFKVKGPKLKPILLTECEYWGDTNAGAPWFKQKRDVYQEALNEAFAIRRGKAPPPMTIFHRGKNEEEARPVFGYPFPVTLIETRFFQPYQAALLSSPWGPYVGGKPDHLIAGLLNETRQKARWQVEWDFSGLDGSAAAYLISKAFEVIKGNFEMDEYDLWDWDFIRRFMVAGPVLAPDGRMYLGKDHGVASGSMFTQLIDTIICLFAIFYCKYADNLNIIRVHGLGDDSHFGINDAPPDLIQMADRVAELGLVLNRKKSRIKSHKEKPHFLGHDWHRFHPTRDVLETLTRLCTPERNRPEYHMKHENPEAYVQALAERILRYQEDNADAWGILQCLLQSILFPTLGQTPYYMANSSSLYFTPIMERIERERWRMRLTVPDERGSPPGAYRAINSWY
jgi:hypothetical protein